jgi:hypothetical protein
MRHRSVSSVLNHVLFVSLAAACGGKVGSDGEISPLPSPPATSNPPPDEGGYSPPGEPPIDGGIPDVLLGRRPDAAQMDDVDVPDTTFIDDAGPDTAQPWDAAACSTPDKPDASGCAAYNVAFYGDPAACGFDSNGYGPQQVCAQLCGLSYAACQLPADGEAILQCEPMCLGRRPENLPAPEPRKQSRLGNHFARAAFLEAASVAAFRILRDELAAHRAPKRLLHAAERAARDELRHARATGALARRFGGEPGQAPRQRPSRARSLEAIALENAVEGCIRETYGALLGAWQARAARDPSVRAAMTRIARDEARHAELSWRVARWIEPRLDRAARTRLAKAKSAAIAQLTREISAEPHPEVARTAGLPSAADAKRLLEHLARELYDAAA